MNLFRIFLIILSINAFGQNTQTIQVTLLDKQTQQPIPDATVLIKKHGFSDKTNENGIVKFKNVPIGRFEIEVSSVTYGKHIFKELLLENSRPWVSALELQPAQNELEEVEVTTENPRYVALMSVESITNEQILRFPATFFDPARLTMSFAGVANTHDQANNISIRGNAPELVQWRMEGVEIVNPNHFSNAGTFFDKPAAVGGGTNILSAQMLGKMDFLSGAFPAGYANSLAGVFDMNLRTGSQDDHRFMIQAGLIGIDLSSEGPISKKTGSSYLFNYRYSFTGLLTQAGIDFGGEAISFQDLAFNFNFPTKKAGTFTFFGMGGLSSNIFTPDDDPANWESAKDLSNTDFYERMGLIGMKHAIKINKDWNLKTVVANSTKENLRNQYSENDNIDYDYHLKNFMSFNSTASGNLGQYFSARLGLGGSYQYYRFNFVNSDSQFFGFDNLLLQPFVRISNRYKSKFNYNIGFISPYYSLSNSQYFEPRLSADYHFKPKHMVKAAYGLHSQLLNNRTPLVSLPLKPARAHHFNLGYQFDIDQKQSVYTEIFYQNLFNLSKSDSLFVSPMNGTEIGYFMGNYYELHQKNQGRNFGIELNYRHYLDNGLFGLLNATFYKSQFKAYDGNFYDTRYAGDYIYNATLGKEWDKNNKIIGLNTRINRIGGFRDYRIQEMEFEGRKYVYFDYENPLYVKYDNYFRVDLRAYIKFSKKKRTETLSLDIQNLTNRKNVAFNYYDVFLNRIEKQYQLGLIPMLNYRWDF